MHRNTPEETSLLASRQENRWLQAVRETLLKALLLAACAGSICVLSACGQVSGSQAAVAAGEPAAAGSGIPQPAAVPDTTMPPASDVVSEEAFAQMFEYYRRDDEVQIRKYLGKDADVVIPAFAGAYPVTEIGMRAFYCCDTLRSVVMPDSVSYIGDSAFEGCSGLQYVVMSGGVVRIGNYAFAKCGSLAKAELPDSLRYLGSGCFYECGALTDIEVPNGVRVLNENTFFGCKSLKTAILPGNLRQFAVTAFAGCDAMTVTAPLDSDTLRVAAGYGLNTVAKATNAGAPQAQSVSAAPASDFTYEFRDGGVVLTDYTGVGLSILLPDRIEGKPVVGICDNAYDPDGRSEDSGWCTPFFIEIPEGVTFIGDGTFSKSLGLRSIILPNSLTSIGADAFSACGSLTNLVIPAGVTDIGAYAFSGTEISDITVPGGVRHPGEALFVENMGLRHILFQEGVRTIPANLCYCERLERVQIPATAASIGEEAFRSSFSLQELTLPEGPTSIGIGAFIDSDLKEFVFPNSIETVGAGAFANTPFLESNTPVDDWITLGNDLVHIYAGMQKRVTVPKGYRNADFYSAFCSSGQECPVEEIVLEDGTSSITDGAFYLCGSLREVIIPDSMTEIGSKAFYGCGALTSVSIPNGVTEIKDEAFSGCESLASIDIPDSVTVIGKGAFSDCVSLNEITIPNSVSSIGADAFSCWSNAPAIRCQAGSYAELYAKQNDLQYVLFRS